MSYQPRLGENANRKSYSWHACVTTCTDIYKTPSETQHCKSYSWNFQAFSLFPFIDASEVCMPYLLALMNVVFCYNLSSLPSSFFCLLCLLACLLTCLLACLLACLPACLPCLPCFACRVSFVAWLAWVSCSARVNCFACSACSRALFCYALLVFCLLASVHLLALFWSLRVSLSLSGHLWASLVVIELRCQ